MFLAFGTRATVNALNRNDRGARVAARVTQQAKQRFRGDQSIEGRVRAAATVSVEIHPARQCRRLRHFKHRQRGACQFSLDRQKLRFRQELIESRKTLARQLPGQAIRQSGARALATPVANGVRGAFAKHVQSHSVQRCTAQHGIGGEVVCGG
jgi:hypothetical protein